MIITHNTDHAPILSNTGAVGEFTIRSSPKAFSILSSGLYKNKIRAIIRELACNAVDSHKAAGTTDTPFDVHFPTTLEPWFSIRDYGVGLNDTEVKNVYTVYFSSTKTSSNDYIGALGLGSKSPFSYTDNFTVTAIKDGVKRVYGAFVNEQGVPSVTLMYEGSTELGPGVEVKFNVAKSADYDSFAREAQVLRWFKTPFNLLNYNAARYGEITYPECIEHNLIPGVHLANLSRSYAIMGNIAYPLDNIPSTEQLGDHVYLLESSLVIEFDIGELDFVASREELSFIPQTYAAIRRRLDDLAARLTDLATGKLSSITCKWLQADTAVKLPRIYRKSLLTVVPALCNPFLEVRYGDIRKAGVSITEDSLKCKNLAISVTNIDFNGKVAHRKPTPPEIGAAPAYTIDTARTVLVVLNDTKRRTHTAAITQAKDSREYARNTVVISVTYTGEDFANRQQAFTEFLDELHTPPNVVYASRFIEKRTEDRRTTSVRKYPVYRGYGAHYGRMMTRQDWVYVEQLAPGEHVYVDYDAYDARSPLGNTYPLVKMMYNIRRAGFQLGEVVGISANRKATVQKTPGWIHIETYLLRELAKVDDATVMHAALCMRSDFTKLLNYNEQLAKGLPADSNLVKTLSLYNALPTDFSTRIDAITNLMSGRDARVTAACAQIDSHFSEIKARYPLLFKMFQGYFTTDEIMGYISLVDSASAA